VIVLLLALTLLLMIGTVYDIPKQFLGTWLLQLKLEVHLKSMMRIALHYFLHRFCAACGIVNIKLK